MAAKRGGLGKGLDTLIPEKKNKVIEKKENTEKIEVKQGEQMMRLSKIEPNRDQPRKNFDEDALAELADSIKQFGVIQPLIVQKKGDYYEIIAGERRWRASKMAGLKEVPVIVREYTDKEVLEIALIENIQRENLNPIEEALAYEKLIKDFKMKQAELAERLSKSRVAITNSLRLLKLDDFTKSLIGEGRISTGHARALLGLENEMYRQVVAHEVANFSLSVRDVEKFVRTIEKNSDLLNQFGELEAKNILIWGISDEHGEYSEKMLAEFELKLDIIKKLGEDELEQLKQELKAGPKVIARDDSGKNIYETFSDMLKSLKKSKPQKKEIANAFIYEDLEQKMSMNLGTKVHLKHKGNGKGKIEIEYYSNDELEHMFELLMSISHI